MKSVDYARQPRIFAARAAFFSSMLFSFSPRICFLYTNEVSMVRGSSSFVHYVYFLILNHKMFKLNLVTSQKRSMRLFTVNYCIL